MNLRSFSIILATFVLASAALGFSQTGCVFNIAGDWESRAPGDAAPRLYRFASDGTVTVVSNSGAASKPSAAVAAEYKLDDPKSPKSIEFRHAGAPGRFPWGPGALQITGFDDKSFTTAASGAEPAVWVRKDQYQYFVVLAAHRGTPPHRGGPAFAMLVKHGKGKSEVETFGLYYLDNRRINGPVPLEIYKKFMNEPHSGQNAMFRLQISSEQFDRSMAILRTWQRRAREGALLFPEYSYLNVIVPIRDIAESLEQCGEKINIYKLTWMVDDELGANVPQWELAYQYVNRLRHLNEAMEIGDEQFQTVNSRVIAMLSRKPE